MDACAQRVRCSLAEWGALHAPPLEWHERLTKTIPVLLRTGNAAWGRAVKLGLTDPRPASRTQPLAGWHLQDFMTNYPVFRFDLFEETRLILPPVPADSRVILEVPMELDNRMRAAIRATPQDSFCAGAIGWRRVYETNEFQTVGLGGKTLQQGELCKVVICWTGLSFMWQLTIKGSGLI